MFFFHVFHNHARPTRSTSVETESKLPLFELAQLLCLQKGLQLILECTIGLLYSQSLVTNNVKKLQLPCFEPATSNITIHTLCPDWTKCQSTVFDSVVLATVPAIVITLAEGIMSIFVVDRQTEETIVSGGPSCCGGSRCRDHRRAQ